MPSILGTSRKSAEPFPAFRPHPLLRDGHSQTLGAHFSAYLAKEYPPQAAHRVTLADGDEIVLHDNRPQAWGPGDGAALLLHGLGGCYRSPYLVRAAAKLNARGVRSFRMDYRTCGAGFLLAKRSYHAGLSEDVRAALAFLTRECPRSPLSLLGYSMGGNLALKTLGEEPAALPETLVRATVVNPAIELMTCSNYLRGPLQRVYDRAFAKDLVRHLQDHPELAAEVDPLAREGIQRIRDFDERFTAPHWGFASVEAYYHAASAARHLVGIAVPTLILHSRDDPLIPANLFETADHSDSVHLHLTRRGGHLGFIGRRGVDPDRRWMDWRMVDWVCGAIGPEQIPDERRSRPWQRSVGEQPTSTVNSPT